jgi:hypothetical protein
VLEAGVVAQLFVERDESGLDRVDERERGRDLRAAGRRQLQLGQPAAVRGAEQQAARRDAVVIEHRLHALLPLAALIDQGVPQPHPGAQLEQVLWRDP